MPPNKQPIGCKWVFRVKYLPDGRVDRYKARHVAKGYDQLPGLDYTGSFSPVAKLVIAVTKTWPLHQLDINNAFLHGFIDEELFMTPSKGYSKAQPGQVCKLQISLYRLKQASR